MSKGRRAHDRAKMQNNEHILLVLGMKFMFNTSSACLFILFVHHYVMLNGSYNLYLDVITIYRFAETALCRCGVIDGTALRQQV